MNTAFGAAAMGEASEHGLPESVWSIVLKESKSLDGVCIIIEGYDFNKGVNYHELLKSMAITGFHASNLGDAIHIVNDMVCLSIFIFNLDFGALFEQYDKFLGYFLEIWNLQ